jgi:hypothetical protein
MKRNPLARLGLSTVLLGAVAAALGVLVGLRLIGGTQSGLLLATAPNAQGIPEMKSDAPALDANLQSVRDRSLLYASRAFYVAPPPPTAPAAPPRPAYVLAGTFLIPHKPAVALLKRNTGTNVLKVNAGDDLEGWRIEAVEAARVVLRFEDERFEMIRAASESGTHLTRVPLTRAAPTASRTTLGSGHPAGPVAASGVNQPLVEARLYRRPSQ